MFSRTSMVANIIAKITSIAGLIHVPARCEAGSFNRDLARGRRGQSYLSKKLFFRVINKRLSDFRKFLITSQNSRKFMFLKFWPASGQNSIKITAALEAIQECEVKYHLEYIVILPLKVDMLDTSANLYSFPEVPKHVEFLNKFNPCLLYGELLHTAKKLLVCDANNSGQSSWARIIVGLMNRSKIVSVTKEITIDLSVVDEDTELIFIDEWSEDTLEIYIFPRWLDCQVSQTSNISPNA